MSNSVRFSKFAGSFVSTQSSSKKVFLYVENKPEPKNTQSGNAPKKLTQSNSSSFIMSKKN